jgi:hypothetical protein
MAVSTLVEPVPVPGLGLGTTAHALPVQCSIRVCRTPAAVSL